MYMCIYLYDATHGMYMINIPTLEKSKAKIYMHKSNPKAANFQRKIGCDMEPTKFCILG